MNLLDKYMIQVGKHLPAKNRLDLQAEIRSTLEDMLEDRSKQSGKPVDDALTAEVLQEFGSPQKVAAGYKPTRYLIGPRLYPFFRMVVRIVFAVLISVALVGFGIQFFSGPQTFQTFNADFGKFIIQLIGGLVSAFGNIVLVFAIIERVKPDAKFDEEDEKWTPAELTQEPDPDQVSRREMVFEILVIVLGLAIFNLYPQVIGLGMFKDNVWVFVPALSKAFFTYLPWINLLAGLNILLDLYLLRQSAWQLATRLISLGIDVGGIILAGAMLKGPSLVNLDPEKMNQIFGPAGTSLTPLFTFLPQMVLVILIVVQSIEAVQMVWKLLTQRGSIKTFPAH